MGDVSMLYDTQESMHDIFRFRDICLTRRPSIPILRDVSIAVCQQSVGESYGGIKRVVAFPFWHPNQGFCCLFHDNWKRRVAWEKKKQDMSDVDMQGTKLPKYFRVQYGNLQRERQIKFNNGPSFNREASLFLSRTHTILYCVCVSSIYSGILSQPVGPQWKQRSRRKTTCYYDQPSSPQFMGAFGHEYRP